MRRADRGSRWLRLASALSVLLMLAGCANALPPQAQPVAPPPPPPANPINPFNPTDGRKQLVVGVDDLGPGFNPHLISDLSPVSTAVASLVLPSVFRPGPDGQPVLDPAVATSATVTSTAPFTVNYELNLSAAWSDNTPIAAEDLVYLWQRMRSEPGVVDNAGYRLITDVRSRAGGKAVDVTFAQAYPQWRELFSDLLPAHLLKDAPQGWRTALADSIPVSGGPFAVTQVDRDRGQLVLARNDHYWATPAVLDNLALRRSDTTSMLGGLRGGDMPVAQTWADTQVAAALAQMDSSVRRLPVPQPIVVQLGMRTDQGVLTDQRVRQAVGALLNRDTLIGIGTGGGNGGVRDDAQLLAPSQPGYQPTVPPGAPSHPDPALAATLLSSAGYQRDAAGHWTLLDTPLSVTIGAPTDRPRFAEIAQEIQRELRAGGITATVVTAQGSALFTDPTVLPTAPGPTPSASPSPGPPLAAGPSTAAGALPPGAGPGVLPPGAFDAAGPLAAHPGHGVLSTQAAAPPRSTHAAQPGPSASPSPAPPAAASGVLVDLEVQPRAVGADLASTAVSNYGCPPGMAGVVQPARNPTGFCSAALQPTLDALLGGAPGAAAANATIEAQLWHQLPAIPLFQIVTTLVSTPKGDQATGTVTAGQLTTGPFATAPRWQPTNTR